MLHIVFDLVPDSSGRVLCIWPCKWPSIHPNTLLVNEWSTCSLACAARNNNKNSERICKNRKINLWSLHYYAVSRVRHWRRLKHGGLYLLPKVMVVLCQLCNSVRLVQSSSHILCSKRFNNRFKYMFTQSQATKSQFIISKAVFND